MFFLVCINPIGFGSFNECIGDVSKLELGMQHININMVRDKFIKKYHVWHNRIALILSDFLSLVVAFYISSVLMKNRVSNILQTLPLQEQDLSRLYFFPIVIAIGLYIFSFNCRHYTYRKPFWTELRDIINVVAIMAMVDLLILSLSKLDYSRWRWLVLWMLVFLLLPIFRQCVKKILFLLNYRQYPCVIIGTNENAHDAYSALTNEHNMCFKVLGFVSANGVNGESPIGNIPLLNCSISDLNELCPDLYYFLALEYEQRDLIDKWLRDFARSHIRNVSVIPTLRGVPLYGTEISHFFSQEILMLRVRNNLLKLSSRFLKRAFDICISISLLFLLSPLFIYLCLQISKDGGSPFFAHIRIGQKGEMFPCYKFRTMVINSQDVLQQLLDLDPEAKAEWNRDFKLKNDPRITNIGLFLRKSSLDELPQLWNVLKGDMSLVGPRPIIAAELERYGDDVEYYLMAKPGMTGLWQVSGRNDTDYATRVYLDAWYVKNWSLWYDTVIMFKTINVVLKRDGAY